MRSSIPSIDDNARRVGSEAATALADDGRTGAAGGMLLFGISTAYIFAVMLQWWPVLSDLLNLPPTSHKS